MSTKLSSVIFYGITVVVPLAMLYFVIEWAASALHQVAGVLAR